jgi:Cation/multidrug efflux pump
MNAALVGARELIGPIIAMTITLAAVYTPIALQGGLTGALFREFALTLAGAVFISGVVADPFADDVGTSFARRSYRQGIQWGR